MQHKQFLFPAIVLAAALTGVVVLVQGDSQGERVGKEDIDATVYYSATCGCCGAYMSYLEQSGVSVTRAPGGRTVEEKKEELAIPSDMRSCHTAMIDGYFVEGHIPLEAISKLLEERPELRGIAMPGMPGGAPGMGGKKTGPFVVYGVSENGDISVFAELGDI